MITRPCRQGDREAVGDVCARTADAGGDSRHPDPVRLPHHPERVVVPIPAR
ncbi:hypothetical protein ACFV4N_14220 [Actinosynnema sp. NPDC059797]